MNNSYLVQYYNECKNGNIIVGAELMMELDQLMEDLNDSEYQFDLTEPHKRISFIEKHCKHSISPFAGAPFLLELWQKAIIEAIYGFYILVEGKWVRRFVEVVLLIARKNGKSTLAAALSLAEFFVGNMGTNIMCASNDYEQAGILFEEIANMREESPALEKVSRKNIRGVFMGNPKRKNKRGKFSYQNKAKIRKLSAKTGGKEGRNLDMATVDEAHEMKDSSLVMPIKQSMSSKEEYLLLTITTEGFVEDGYLDHQTADARAIWRGERINKRKLNWFYTQDNEEEIWQDPNSWYKSNPNLGVSKTKRYLEDLIEEAKVKSGERAFMLAKDFNIKQGSAQAWLPTSDIVNVERFELSDFIGAFYISGNDFAETTDLCASSILLKKADDHRTYIHTHYWIPESKIEHQGALDLVDDVDYRAWEREGHLTIVEGNAVNSADIADWHYELLKEYDLKPFKSGYDNRFAKDFKNRYIDIFGKDIAINIPQDAKVLNNPIRTLEADMRDKLVNYDNNPMCLWNFKNTGIKVDSQSRVMLTKMSTTKRIDGSVSKVIAYAVLEWYRSEFLSLVKG